MEYMNCIAGAILTGAEHSLRDYAVTGFFGIGSFLFFIFLQLVGTRVFVKVNEAGRIGPRVFALVLLLLGLTGAVFSSFMKNVEASLVLGFASGLFIWTSLFDIPEQMHWINPCSRKSLFLFLTLAVLWTAGILFLSDIPAAIFGATGYPLLVWGMELARNSVISKWGPSSLAATILILLTSAVAGGSLAVGIVHGSIFSGIIGGVIFAIATWSALEIIWERGMAQRPWKNSRSRT
mgnify:CR=1 FL=1